MPGKTSFNYAIVRVTPFVEREEFFNAGVILFCCQKQFLAARTELDPRRLAALAPHHSPAPLKVQLDLIARVCAGGKSAGPLAALSQAERFDWLTSPRSTVIQTSAVHSGLCDDPQAMLDHLFETMVRVR